MSDKVRQVSVIWAVENDEGEVIGVFDNEDSARECARENRQKGNWDAVVACQYVWLWE